MKGIFIFRRDLRLSDNTALNRALKECQEVTCCFFFDPRQQGHEYFSVNGFEFLVSSLKELDVALREHKSRLVIYDGKPEDIIPTLTADAVYLNADYTPFSQKRDEKIAAACKQAEKKFVSCHDALLTQPGSITTGTGEPYKVFTPFWRTAREQSVPEPTTQSGTFAAQRNDPTFPTYERNPHLAVQPGRDAGLKILSTIQHQAGYEDARNNMAANKTTHLSAHLKFGTVSVREAYYAIAQELGIDHPLLRQLYWRDFLTHIAYHYPHIFGSAFKRKYNSILWENNQELFDAWCRGETGVPVVDAGMRELTTTGFMHNRARMITASYLVKDYHVDWQWGEKFFAQHLVDYDPAVNNGNWQWAASTGCDAQPYFRIFNPWRQQERFDPACEYIKRWIPELRELSSEQIHALHKTHPLTSAYPKERVVHKERAAAIKEQFKG